MKKRLRIIGALAMVFVLSLAMSATAMAASDEYVPDPDAIASGWVDVELPDPRLRINVGDHEEPVGETNKGGTWRWGIYSYTGPLGGVHYKVYSKLSCIAYQSRTSVKPGAFANWITSGWKSAGVTASVTEEADSFWGGNKAAYDYQ